MYKILSQVRANGKLYSVGDILPGNLKKINYEDLLNLGLVEEIKEEKPRQTSVKPKPKAIIQETKIKEN